MYGLVRQLFTASTQVNSSAYYYGVCILAVDYESCVLSECHANLCALFKLQHAIDDLIGTSHQCILPLQVASIK